MLSFKKILFPVDFSDRCHGTAHYVVALAGRFNSEVILLHVAEMPVGPPGDIDFQVLAGPAQWESREARAREALDRFLEGELKLVNVTRHVETGDPGRTIVRVAESEHVDLIMMPTHGYGGFRRFILGSVAAKVLHDARCPVWTGIHMEGAPPLEAISIRNILCAVDTNELAKPALEAAAQLADEYGAALTVSHVVPGTEAVPEMTLDNELKHALVRQARQRIEAMFSEARIKDAKLCIDSGDVQKVVAACAKAHHADLMVIGRSHQSGLGRLRAHSYAIIRESPCPVLSV